MDDYMTNNNAVQCSFCKKLKDDVNQLIADKNGTAFICDSCIMISIDALLDDLRDTETDIRKKYINQLIDIIKNSLSN